MIGHVIGPISGWLVGVVVEAALIVCLVCWVVS